MNNKLFHQQMLSTSIPLIVFGARNLKYEVFGPLRSEKTIDKIAGLQPGSSVVEPVNEVVGTALPSKGLVGPLSYPQCTSFEGLAVSASLRVYWVALWDLYGVFRGLAGPGLDIQYATCCVQSGAPRVQVSGADWVSLCAEAEIMISVEF